MRPWGKYVHLIEERPAAVSTKRTANRHCEDGAFVLASSQASRIAEGTIRAMTRSELIAVLASRFPALTAQDAAVSVKEILDAFERALARGGRSEIRGFGSFGLSRHPSRTGRNPKTGQTVFVPAKWAAHFKAGKELRQRVDQSAQR